MDVENKTLKKEGASTGTVILEALFPELYRSPSHRGVELLHDALGFGLANIGRKRQNGLFYLSAYGLLIHKSIYFWVYL